MELKITLLILLVLGISLLIYYYSNIKIIIIRHGETDWNAAHLIQGQADIPLNANGIKQVNNLKSIFNNQKYKIIYSSDLSRTRETAVRIAEVTGAKIIQDKRLRERSFGKAEGLTREKAAILFQKDHLPGVESKEDHLKRILGFLTNTVKFGTKKIIIIAHAGVVHRLCEYIGKKVFEPDNASITTFNYNLFTRRMSFISCQKTN